MDGDMLCGGFGYYYACVQLQQGQWITFPWRLNNLYAWHVTWRKPNGDLILMNSNLTTEVVTASGPTSGFTLKHSA